MWNAYWADYSCIYTGLNTNAYTIIYHCAGVSVNCSSITTCFSYSNQRACDYDSCNINCNWDGSCIASSGGTASFSPFTKLWNFFKGLLTRETGKAITGDAVGDGKIKERNESFFGKIGEWFKKFGIR